MDIVCLYIMFLVQKVLIDKKVETVIISSHKYQKQIYEELIGKYNYAGKIIELYNDFEKKVFFKLQSKSKNKGIFDYSKMT